MDARRTTLYNLPPELADHPQYEVLRELGAGGMGVVYLAKNKLMDRPEVLKVVNKALLDRPESVERFLREIRSAAKLNHPNVVTAYSALQIGELLVFAMEYVEGEDLQAVVKARGPLPVVNACQYVQQAAIGLQHAFEKGMVHRDIKPHNLILAREGKRHIVKILDFGLAKATREKTDDTALTGVGQMMGTPDYMAPEQSLDAAKADIRADIYSLGCTLYHLLTGAPPFRGKSLGAILLAHQTTEARAVNAVRPEVPSELTAVVRKMMAKEPAQRYQTPAEVVKVLGAVGKLAAKNPPPELSPGVPAPAEKGRSQDEKNLLQAETILPPAEAAQPTMLGPIAPPLSRHQSVPVGRHWLRRSDVLVAVLLLIVLGGIGASGLVHLWRDHIYRRECENNLRLIWGGLQQYCDTHEGNFPRVEERGPRSVAGIFVPILCDNQMLSPDVSLACPAQGRRALQCRSVHDLEELYANQPEVFHQEARQLAGNYAYTLGYRDGAGHHGLRCDTTEKDSLPIMADRLESLRQSNSPNHGGRGQNILFLSGNVRFCTQRTVGIDGDDIYTNWDQQVLAGKAREDTVLGPSDASLTPAE